MLMVKDQVDIIKINILSSKVNGYIVKIKITKNNYKL